MSPGGCGTRDASHPCVFLPAVAMGCSSKTWLRLLWSSCSPPASAVVDAGNAHPAPQGWPGPPQHPTCVHALPRQGWSPIPALHLPSVLPTLSPFAIACLPAAALGRRDANVVGLNATRKNLLWVMGCSAALHASTVAARDPGSCSPSRSHGDTEAFLPAAARFGGGTLHVHGSLPTRLFP